MFTHNICNPGEIRKKYQQLLVEKKHLMWNCSYFIFSDFSLLIIFLLNVATDTFIGIYVSYYLFGRPVEITERQKQLLGVKDSGEF